MAYPLVLLIPLIALLDESMVKWSPGNETSGKLTRIIHFSHVDTRQKLCSVKPEGASENDMNMLNFPSKP